MKTKKALRYDFAFHPLEKEFANTYPELKDAWAECMDGDLLMKIARNLKTDKKLIILAAAKCANLVANLMIDKRSVIAVETAIKYTTNQASKEEFDIANKNASLVDSKYWSIKTFWDFPNHEKKAARIACCFGPGYDPLEVPNAVSDAKRAKILFDKKLSNEELSDDEFKLLVKAFDKETADICREILFDAVSKHF